MQYTYNEETGMYDAIAREGVNPIAALPEDDEQQWALEHEAILPVQQNEDYKSGYAVEWAFDGAEAVNVSVSLTAESLAALEASMDESRFSYSIVGGDFANTTGLGVNHPTSLGDGMLDFIPKTARSLVWAPLGMSVFFQFLLLGVFGGALLGGSQWPCSLHVWPRWSPRRARLNSLASLASLARWLRCSVR